ncbi:MAG: hypothetical protein K8S20_04145 [Chloroflexi bacterium]|nr:hypothetical protein [Chloroflexota bacterium]
MTKDNEKPDIWAILLRGMSVHPFVAEKSTACSARIRPSEQVFFFIESKDLLSPLWSVVSIMACNFFGISASNIYLNNSGA